MMDNQEDIISSINKTIEEYKKKNPSPKVLILDSFALERTRNFSDMIKGAKKVKKHNTNADKLFLKQRVKELYERQLTV